MEKAQKYFPTTRGPFRGLVIKFQPNSTLIELQRVLGKITLGHPNFINSTMDKYKSILYYKSPYDVAMIMDAYKDYNTFKMEIFFDKLSKTLHPEIIHIPPQHNENISNIIYSFRGKILIEDHKGCQIKFREFKDAALAQEELRKYTQPKFAYLSELPNQGNYIPKEPVYINNNNVRRKESHRSPASEAGATGRSYKRNDALQTNHNITTKKSEIPRNHVTTPEASTSNKLELISTKPTEQASKEQLEMDVLEILRKHAGWIPNTLPLTQNNQEFDNESIAKKIRLASQNLSLTDVSSINTTMDITDNNEDNFDGIEINLDANDSSDWETKTPKEQFEKLKKITRTINNKIMENSDT